MSGHRANDDEKWLILRNEASLKRIADAFESLRKAGFAPVLIKGWAIARRYPSPWQRPYSDIDLCIAPAEFKRAEAFLRSSQLGLGIDLHHGLRHLDAADWNEVFRRTEIVEVHGTPVRMLCNEDHLRVLATHWLNDGGSKRERLLDVYYCVTGDGKAFDWNLALQQMPAHRRAWIAKTVSACMRYHESEFPILPFSESELELPRWFTETLEREWASEPLYPLYYLLGQPRRFATQLRRRFPPNPIQATIEMDAPIDSRSRLYYQLATFLKRIPTSIRLSLRVIR